MDILIILIQVAVLYSLFKVYVKNVELNVRHVELLDAIAKSDNFKVFDDGEVDRLNKIIDSQADHLETMESRNFKGTTCSGVPSLKYGILNQNKIQYENEKLNEMVRCYESDARGGNDEIKRLKLKVNKETRLRKDACKRLNTLLGYI